MTAEAVAELVGFASAVAIAVVPSFRLAVRAEARRAADARVAELAAKLPCQGDAPSPTPGAGGTPC